LTTKRTPLKYDLRSLFSERTNDDRGLEFFISQSELPGSISQEIVDPDTSIKKVRWQEVLQRIKKKSNPQVFFWFTPLKAVTETQEILVLKANNQFDRDWIENHYLEFIKDTIEEIYGITLEVKIISDDSVPLQKEGKSLKKEEKQKESKLGRLFTGFLSPNYTFDRFIVGPSNQFAHAASTAVARNPGEAYNPLFIYGGVGLGKTHLINAIGNEVLKSTSNMARICCISAEHFTNQVNNLPSFDSFCFSSFLRLFPSFCSGTLSSDMIFTSSVMP